MFIFPLRLYSLSVVSRGGGVNLKKNGADHSPSSGVEVKFRGVLPPLPSHSFSTCVNTFLTLLQSIAFLC